MTKVSEHDFNEWMRNPVTQIIRKWMSEDRADCIYKIGSDHEMEQKAYPSMAIKWAAMVNIYDCWLSMNYNIMQETGHTMQETAEGN